MDRRSSFGFFLLLLIIFASLQEMAVQTEARVCESQSHRFKGTCLRDRNCALVCNSEGFPRGKCIGFRRRCFCTRPC